MYECDPFVYLKSFRFLAITTGNFFFFNKIKSISETNAAHMIRISHMLKRLNISYLTGKKTFKVFVVVPIKSSPPPAFTVRAL